MMRGGNLKYPKSPDVKDLSGRPPPLFETIDHPPSLRVKQSPTSAKRLSFVTEDHDLSACTVISGCGRPQFDFRS